MGEPGPNADREAIAARPPARLFASGRILYSVEFTFEWGFVRVRDLDAAIAFFKDVLGMTPVERDRLDYDQPEVASLASPKGTAQLELTRYNGDIPAPTPFRDPNENVHVGFAVDDFDGALRRLERAGYKPEREPDRGEDGDFAYLPVLEGILLHVYYIKKPPPSRGPRGE